MSFQPSSIPLFEEENYDFWCIKMKTLFINQDVWDLVGNGFDELENVITLTSVEKKKLKELKKMDAKALLFIQQGVGNNIFPRIMRASKAKEAWDILQQEFQTPLNLSYHYE